MITLDCPHCESLVEPDLECKECYGTGVQGIYCVRCCRRHADRYQGGEPVCAGCGMMPAAEHPTLKGD